MNLLAAVRCGEMQPIMLARTVATLDHMLEGRLTINIISSDFPGQKEDSAYRYQRSREVVEILKQAWTQDEINYEGEIYNFSGLTTEPARPYQQNGGPLLYFGGYSPAAVELCAQHCDVYLMWPETREELAARMATVNERADFLRGEKEIDAAIVKAALDECGMKEIEYERDYFGRIIYPNFPV